MEPLEHGRLPDSEALAIRALVDRIEALENELSRIRKNQPTSELEEKVSSLEQLVSVGVSTSPAATEENCTGVRCCNIEDKALQEFLGGSGL